MKNTTRKLFALNLALLLVCSLLPLPALALETDTLLPEETFFMEAGAACERTLTARSNGLGDAEPAQPAGEPETQSEGEDVVTLAGTGYTISVGSTYFTSDEDCSGSGWVYYADGHELHLNGYQGSSIRASGDLVIYSEGINRVTGSNGTYYGGNGISVSGGDLDIFILRNSSLTVTAGSGRTLGGDAVSVSDGALWCGCFGSASFTAGNTTGSNNLGGDALYGSYGATLYGSGITARGGNSYQGAGGCAVISSQANVSADCTLTGGSGNYAGPAVYFGYTGCFGLVNATLNGGSGLNNEAIQYSDGGSLTFHPHTSLYGSIYSLQIRVNSYILTLFGGGGTLHGSNATYTSLQAYYPTWYDLEDYLFTRSGYTQVAWANASGDLTPLKQSYRPVQNTWFEATWERSGEQDILLIGTDGTFAGGEPYQKASGQAVVLPTQMNFPDDSSLLAWGSHMTASPNQLYTYPGSKWYAGGDRVTPDAEKAEVLYAWNNDGAFAVYHPNGGSVKSGGSVELQGATAEVLASDTELKVYALDGDVLTPPENFAFAGWSAQPGSTTADYQAGEPITLHKGAVTDLYAVWERTVYVDTPESGVTVKYSTVTHTVDVALSDDWCRSKGAQTVICAQYSGGKTLAATVRAYRSGQGITLQITCTGNQLPECRFFVLDSDYRPCSNSFTCSWTG